MLAMKLPALSYAIQALYRAGLTREAEVLANAEDIEAAAFDVLAVARTRCPAAVHALWSIGACMTEPTDPPT